MRISILIGLGLVVIGFVALYQVKNGFLMSAMGHVTYAPPEDHDELRAAFRSLAAEEASTPGHTLGATASARAQCALQLSGLTAPAEVREAFQRFNLMMLGAGVGSSAPVIDPEAHYIAEIQRTYVREAAAWRQSRLSNGEALRLRNIFATMSAKDHPVYADLDLGAGFAYQDFRTMVDAMERGGEDFMKCAEDARGQGGA